MRKYITLFTLICLCNMFLSTKTTTETKEKNFMFPFLDLPEMNDNKNKCPADSTLEVSGTGKTSVRADIIKIGIEISTFDSTSASKALQVNNLKVANLQKLLTNKLRLEPEQISTVSFSLNPVYKYSETGVATLIGFRASQIVEIVVDDIDLAGKIIDLIASEVNILYVVFEVSEETILENRTVLIRTAFRDAKNKARIAARKAHYKIIGIKTVKIIDNSTGVVELAKTTRAADNTNLIGNTQSISVNVEITYNIEKRAIREQAHEMETNENEKEKENDNNKH